jgi:acylphosphatase
MATKIVQAHVLIEGRVQGVFYRMWVGKTAEELGIKGWVKNKKDGQVEAVFVGTKSKVEKMIKECKKGPRLAEVDNVDVSWEKVSNQYSSFEILR